jgi:predicted nucleic acid-binding Zn ribbon protein
LSFVPFVVCDVCGKGAPLIFDERIESEEFGGGESFKIPEGWVIFGDAPDLAEAEEVKHTCSEPCAEKLRTRAVS